MQLVFEIVFWGSALAMLHTYVFYPILLYLLTANKKNKNTVHYIQTDNLPEIAVICAAYNEEKVIEEKIISTFDTGYPKEKITFYIGTDACSDNTVAIVKKLQSSYPNLKLIEFTERAGKIRILNKLCAETTARLLVMTDANVYFNPNTFFKLTKHFKNPEVHMVCGNINKRPLNSDAVTQNELQYMNFENYLKYAESKKWQIVMGAEGGCYALRKESFSKVPANFNVDDFFITCLVLRSKKQIVFEPEALVHEDVASNTRNEFRRKVRIAAGNFQNLFYFKDLLYKFWGKTGFAFLSHKVLRWLTPFFFLFNYISCVMLIKTHVLFEILFFTQLFLLVLPLLNYVLVAVKIRIKIIISLSHFMMMNAALFVGFVRYTRGVGSSVWQPVDR